MSYFYFLGGKVRKKYPKFNIRIIPNHTLSVRKYHKIQEKGHTLGNIEQNDISQFPYM
jgi:hypothetical protein